ncbi:hypothetical protein ES703_42940 [subsurface metagenome]
MNLYSQVGFTNSGFIGNGYGSQPAIYTIASNIGTPRGFQIGSKQAVRNPPLSPYQVMNGTTIDRGEQWIKHMSGNRGLKVMAVKSRDNQIRLLPLNRFKEKVNPIWDEPFSLSIPLPASQISFHDGQVSTEDSGYFHNCPQSPALPIYPFIIKQENNLAYLAALREVIHYLEGFSPCRGANGYDGAFLFGIKFLQPLSYRFQHCPNSVGFVIEGDPHHYSSLAYFLRLA